jgi:hypothetical protein
MNTRERLHRILNDLRGRQDRWRKRLRRARRWCSRQWKVIWRAPCTCMFCRGEIA